MDRTKIIEGPAVIIFDGVTYYTKADIVWSFGIQAFNLPSATHGVLDSRYDDIVSKISFNPVGVFSEYIKLWKPFETPVLGSSLLGNTDKSCVIHTVAGQEITLKGAGLTKIPGMDFSAVKTMTGAVEITAVGENSAVWSADSKRFAIEAKSFADTSLNPDDIYTQPYTLSLGASPYASIETEEGVHVEYEMGVTARKTDTAGTVDLRLSNFAVTASFTPVGLSESEYAALFGLQGAGVGRGKRIGGSARTMTITGTGVHYILYGAVPVDGGLVFAADKGRTPAIKLQGVRSFAAGALQPLFYIGTAAPIPPAP